MQTPGEFGFGSNIAAQSAMGSMAAGDYNPANFRAQRVGAPGLNYFQMQGPGLFNTETAQQYMSPYMQNVLDVEKREAINDARQGQLVQDLGAARQGTYGGSRQLLAAMQRERNLGRQLGDIQTRGLQSAFENAQQQFERDRTAGINVGGQNLQAALGVQQLGADTGLRAALANQQTGLEAQRLGEQSRQFGAQQRLAGYGQAGGLAQTLANLGSARSQADLSRLGFQTQQAAQEQALNQQYLDTAYQDFLRQRDYPLEMLQQYSSLLRGVPVTPNSTSTTYAPAPGLGQQLLGTGLGAASIYKTFMGG